MPFLPHSCALLFFSTPQTKGSLLVLPLVLRASKEDSNFLTIAEEVFSSCRDARKGWRALQPLDAFRVEPATITDQWLAAMADLQLNALTGALPFGDGKRAAALRDNRRIPSPTYVFEWLLPLLRPHQDKEAVQQLPQWKRLDDAFSFGGAGIPWRRSQVWAALRLTLSLCQRLMGFDQGAYKRLVLLYCSWLTKEAALILPMFAPSPLFRPQQNTLPFGPPPLPISYPCVKGLLHLRWPHLRILCAPGEEGCQIGSRQPPPLRPDHRRLLP